MKYLLWLLGGLAIGAGLLWYCLRSVSVANVFELMRHADVVYLLLAVALSLAFIAIKTQRWVVLLGPVSGLRFSDLHSPVYAGSAANLAISHAGELVRAKMLGQRRGLPTSTALASIGLERLLDMLAMLLLLGYLFIASGGHLTPALATAVRVAAILALVAATCILSVVLWPAHWARAIDRVTRTAPESSRRWIMTHFEAAVGGFNTIKSAKHVLQLVAISVLQWSAIAASIWCCMKALDISAGPTAPVAVLVLLVIGLTLPTAPAYVGTTQAAFVAALGVFGVMEEAAFAASALYTAFVVMPVFFIGTGALLWYFGSRERDGGGYARESHRNVLPS